MMLLSYSLFFFSSARSPPTTDAEQYDITAGPANDHPAPACPDTEWPDHSDHPDAHYSSHHAAADAAGEGSGHFKASLI